MKLTIKQLKQMIKEELKSTMKEWDDYSDYFDYQAAQKARSPEQKAKDQAYIKSRDDARKKAEQEKERSDAMKRPECLKLGKMLKPLIPQLDAANADVMSMQGGALATPEQQDRLEKIETKVRKIQARMKDLGCADMEKLTAESKKRRTRKK